MNDCVHIFLLQCVFCAYLTHKLVLLSIRSWISKNIFYNSNTSGVTNLQYFILSTMLMLRVELGQTKTRKKKV